MRNRYVLLIATALIALLAVAALADDKTPPEPKSWTPTLSDGPMADVADTEPNSPRNLAQFLGCGNTFRPATIGAPADTDYVWFTATAGTIVQIGTDADGTTGQIGDTRIRLFDAAGTVLATDDDSGPGLYSLITYTLTATGNYYVGLAAYSATSTGAYKAFITCQEPTPPPVNDTCAGALPIQCGDFSLSGTTLWATNDYTPIASGLGGCTGYAALGKDVVYSINATAGDSLHVVYTSTADASIYLITDCSNPSGTCVAGKDATLSGAAETLDYKFTTGGVYYLILDSYGTNTSGTWTAVGTRNCYVVAAEPVNWSQVKTLFR